MRLLKPLAFLPLGRRRLRSFGDRLLGHSDRFVAGGAGGAGGCGGLSFGHCCRLKRCKSRELDALDTRYGCVLGLTGTDPPSSLIPFGGARACYLEKHFVTAHRNSSGSNQIPSMALSQLRHSEDHGTSKRARCGVSEYRLPGITIPTPAPMLLEKPLFC